MLMPDNVLAKAAIFPILFRDEQARAMIQQVAEREEKMLRLALVSNLSLPFLSALIQRIEDQESVPWDKVYRRLLQAAMKGHLRIDPEMKK